VARHFKNWLSAYIDYTRDSESPLSFHFWTGIATIAGALRRRVWLDMRKFVWTPNFYIILVGPPGVAAKSTSISIGLDLLTRLPPEVGIHFGPESMTWQKLADELAKTTEFVKYISLSGKDEQMPMSALTISVGELGTFLQMEDDKLLSFLIKMWDGGDTTFRHATKSSGSTEVRNPWLNVIAATTPTWLSKNFPAEMIGGGLTSRIIFVYGDAKRTLIPYPDEVILDAEYIQVRRCLVDDLFSIAQLAGPYYLEPDARDWGRQWYTRLFNGARPQHMASERYSGYIARKQTHLHKIAMVLAASRGDKLLITRDDLVEADALITTLEPSMMRVFEHLGVVDEARHLNELTVLLRHKGTMPVDELWSLCVMLMPMRSFEEAIKAGTRSGILRTGQDHGRSTLTLLNKTIN
jgi:hypothetical protein